MKELRGKEQGPMKFVVRKYYSGYCSHEVEANSEDQAYEMVNGLSPNYDEVLETLEDWEECNEVESI